MNYYKQIETTRYGTKIETDCFGNRLASHDHKIRKIMNQAYNQYDEDHSVIIFVPEEMYEEAMYCFRNGVSNSDTVKQYPRKNMVLKVALFPHVNIEHFDIVYVINPNEIPPKALKIIKAVPCSDGVLHHIYL